MSDSDPATGRRMPPRVTTASKMMWAVVGLLGVVGFGAVSLIGPGNGGGKRNGGPPANEVHVTPEHDVQKRLDNLKSGQVLVFGKGEYKPTEIDGKRLGPPWRLDKKSGVTLRAEDGVVIRCDNDPPLTVVECEGVKLQKLKIQFTSKTRTFPALLVKDSKTVAIDDCSLSSTKGSGLVVERCPKAVVEQTTVSGSDWGIQLRSSRGTKLLSTTIHDCRQLGALLVTDSPAVTAQELTIRDCRAGVEVERGSQLLLESATIEGASTNGLAIREASAVTIKSGTIKGSGEYAVYLDSGGGLTIQALVLVDNDRGINAKAGATSLIVRSLDHGKQRTPLRIEGSRTPDGWSIAPGIPVEHY